MTDRKTDPRREIRCCRCNKLIAKAHPDAVRAGKDVEIKCANCNEFNYVTGRPEAA